MISGIIVGATLAAAAVFVAVWLLRPDFRRRVEQPKHEFQARLARYDRQPQAAPGTARQHRSRFE